MLTDSTQLALYNNVLSSKAPNYWKGIHLQVRTCRLNSFAYKYALAD